MRERVGALDPSPGARAWARPDPGPSPKFPERSSPRRRTPVLRVVLVLTALVWTQFPFGGARAEGGQALALCCAWGKTMEDGNLTYSVASGDPATDEVIRGGVREWDDALAALSLTELPAGSKVDVEITFVEDVGRTEGQAVTSFTQRGLIRQVDVEIKGGRAPGNSGGLIQIAKHEFGHALGLGHANYDGNLMSEAVSPQPSPIPACAVQGVVEANRWKMVEPQARRPQRPQVSEVPC